MTHTVAEFPDSLIPFRARFYERPDSNGGMLNARYVDNSYKWAGGGFLSTTEDLAQFGEVMLEGTLLKPATVKMLWTPQRTSDGKATDYGMGWGRCGPWTGGNGSATPAGAWEAPRTCCCVPRSAWSSPS